MNFIKKNWRKLVLLSYIFFIPVFGLYADSGGPVVNPPVEGIKNPIPSIDSIPGFIHKILVGFVSIGLPIVALAIVYSGFLFVFARGNPEKLKEAKGALLYSLIGGALLLGAWAIANMISATVLAL